uniref:Beta-lactamase-related domain-containing protein n=1 Tax=Ditylenchus dipsaci TaxID=166011 RepID=A0A915CQU3_9BILA
MKQSFSKILENEEGLALAVYHKDELVVDLWGGYADKSCNQLWKEDTMSRAYSATKIFGSLVVASLVSQGRLAYQDLVVKHWPEFGKHGKDILTVEDLVNHKAGLIAFSAGQFTIEEAKNLDLVSKIIEDSVPYWELGIKRCGYHASTIGFILDQLVRRVDEKKRTISQFYLEEVQPNIQHGEQFYIGLPKEKFYLAAPTIIPTLMETLRYTVKKPIQTLQFATAKYLDPKGKGLMNLAITSIEFFEVSNGKNTYNNPDVISLQNCASTGVGTARGLAQAAQYFFKSKLITNEVKEMCKHPTEKTSDLLIDFTFDRGHGFVYLPDRLDEEEFVIVQMGYGGQFCFIDLKNDTTVVLLRNKVMIDFSKSMVQFCELYYGI